MMKFIQTILVALIWGGIAWLAGFLVFALHIATIKEATVDGNLLATDAVVVLTGGSDRVRAGLEILKNHAAKKLLISGVSPRATMDAVLHNQDIPKELSECCIVLGREALSTTGNAKEAAAWMDQENYKTMRLVTANYHMPRSLLYFRTVLPTTTIIPHPVVPAGLESTEWIKHPPIIRLLAMEYTKFLIAWAQMKITAWAG